ncbi:hypothetical protein ACOTEY_30250 [Achromobacter xylosoxidans]
MVESNKLPVRYPEFAARVKDAMVRAQLEVQGIVDALKRRGVRITYEMVRRYTLGQAMPRQDKMAEIASILNVSPSFLQYGTETGVAAKKEKPVPKASGPTRSPFYPFLRVPPEAYAALDDDDKDELEMIIENRIRRASRAGQGKSPIPGSATGTDGA